VAITIVTTPGAEDANSYVTVAEATAYFEAMLGFTAIWTAYSDDVKKARLVAAARGIDRLAFMGYKADLDQALEFPRAEQRSDIENPVTEIPRKVKDAQCEMVVYQAQTGNATTGQLSEQDVIAFSLSGVMSVGFAAAVNSSTKNVMAGSNYDAIMALLRQWVGSPNQFVMVK